MTTGLVGVSPAWLQLREAADAPARATDLVDHLIRLLPAADRICIHDVGCGTGAMGRWLAPRLTGPQHWIGYDWDPELLARAAAAAGVPGPSADGALVTVETRTRDITRLEPGDFAGASLVTASALLDTMTESELDGFVTTCVRADCPALLTLSVSGRVELSPADPLDLRIADAFNAHQRRTVDGRRLLGPDAVGAAADAFTRLGAEVLVRPSVWRLGPDLAALAAEWLAGWVAAACEQQPELAVAADEYVQRRLADARAGRLDVSVHHHDLLAWPRRQRSHDRMPG
jgi:SAM-dependent methyltransferase